MIEDRIAARKLELRTLGFARTGLYVDPDFPLSGWGLDKVVFEKGAGLGTCEACRTHYGRRFTRIVNAGWPRPIKVLADCLRNFVPEAFEEYESEVRRENRERAAERRRSEPSERSAWGQFRFGQPECYLVFWDAIVAAEETPMPKRSPEQRFLADMGQLLDRWGYLTEINLFVALTALKKVVA